MASHITKPLSCCSFPRRAIQALSATNFLMSRRLSTILAPANQPIILDDSVEPEIWQPLPDWFKGQKKYNQVFLLGDSVTAACDLQVELQRPPIVGSFARGIERRRRRYTISQDIFWIK
eukprot:768746-Hanusia_phi.AAC.10